MASQVTEEMIINKLAEHCATIDGVVSAFGFAQNPDSLQDPQLPAFIFYPRESNQQRRGHNNVWTNEIVVRGLFYVTKRMTAGGNIKVVENRALVFPQRIRAKFQTASVIQEFLSLGLQVADMRNLSYGSGGELVYMGTEYVGFTIEWIFKETR